MTATTFPQPSAVPRRFTALRWNTHSGWLFVILWYAASFVGGVLYFIPVSAVYFLLRLDNFGEPENIAAANRAFVALATASVAAACGLSIGLFQWLVLRREVAKIKLWIAATAAGFASLGVLPLLVGVWFPGWSDWAYTLIINGKFHWLARVVPAWPLADWLAGVVTLTLFGAVVGLIQWWVLRKHMSRAGSWILVSAVGWFAGAVASTTQNSFWDVLASWDIPVLITGTGMAWLLRNAQSGAAGPIQAPRR